MHQLGNTVLKKIQNLIVKIDKNTQKSKKLNNRSYLRNQQYRDEVDEGQNNRQDPYYHMSYQYLNHNTKQMKIKQKQACESLQQKDNFTVNNLTSLHILSKSDYVPIDKRTKEVLSNKQKFIEMIKTEIVRKEDKTLQVRTNKEKKLPQAELSRIIVDMEEKFKQRALKKNTYKLQFIKKEVFSGIPAINKSSQSLLERRNLKKNFSNNVFIRMQQEIEDRYRKQYHYVKKIKQEESPFTPVICNKSRKILSKSNNRQSVCDVRHSSFHEHCSEGLNQSRITPKNKFTKSVMQRSISTNFKK